jgi:hypothetical protein
MHVRSLLALLALTVPWIAAATTLERLSLDEMTAKATAIVRGRVTASWCAPRGSLIYTHYRIQVSERWKGPAATEVEVVVPGGSANGVRQSFAGTPKLTEGAEYVLFLWTGSSGLTHILGFTQGVFDLKRDASGAVIAVRAATSETLLDPTSERPVNEEPLRLKLDELSHRVRMALAAGRR